MNGGQTRLHLTSVSARSSMGKKPRITFTLAHVPQAYAQYGSGRHSRAFLNLCQRRSAMRRPS